MKIKEQIKVCHISTVHNRYDPRIFYKECSSLAKANYKVFLVITATKRVNEVGVEIIPLSKIRNRFLRLTLKVSCAFFLSLKLKAEIYHIHDPELIPTATLIKLFKHVKIIYDIHEDHYKSIMLKPWIKNKFLASILVKSYALAENLLLPFFDALILAEQSLAERYNTLKSRNKSITVLNYPIIGNRLFEGENLETDIQILNPSNLKLIYTGNINEQRGIWNIIYSFIALSKKRGDLDLYLIGFTDEKLYQKINKVLEGENLCKNVWFEGIGEYVKSQKIKKYYQFMNIALALIPSSSFYEDKILTKFYEYMQFGLPIVASDFPLWKDFIEGNNIGINVDPINPELVAEKINFLLNNPELRKEMSKRGKELIKTKYNWTLEENKLIELYSKILTK